MTVISPIPAEKLALNGPLTGTVMAELTVPVSFQVSGQVSAVLFQTGDKVRKGDVLARLDSSMLEAQYAQSLGVLKQAEAQSNLLNAGSRPEEVAVARAHLASAQAASAAASAEYQRASQLFSEGVISRSQLEQADSRAKQAVEAEAAARQGSLLAEEGPRKEQKDAATAALVSAGAAVQAAQVQLDFATLLSPMDGYLIVRHIEPGQAVTAGLPAMEVASLDNLELHTMVPEGDLERVSIGQKALVEFPSLAGVRAQAEVCRITPRADTATRGFPIVLRLSSIAKPSDGGDHEELENSESGIGQLASAGVKPGVIALATLEDNRHSGRLAIPIRCIVSGAVFLVEGGRAVRHTLTEEQIAGEYALCEGLDPTMQVISNGQDFVADGEAVRVVQALSIDSLTELSQGE